MKYILYIIPKQNITVCEIYMSKDSSFTDLSLICVIFAFPLMAVADDHFGLTLQ